MRIWKNRILVGLIFSIGLFLLACSQAPAQADGITVGDVVRGTVWNVWNHYNTLNNQQPVPWNSLKYSNERQNIIRRTTAWSDPNKRGFIYLLNNDGSVEAFYSIKGKVSALDSSLTPNVGCAENATYDYQCAVVDLPQPDGSFGTNGQGIYFFTANGTYVEWNGKYLLTDRPVQLTQQPKIVVTVAGDGA